MSIFIVNKFRMAVYMLFDISSLDGKKKEEVLEVMAGVFQKKDLYEYNMSFQRLIEACFDSEKAMDTDSSDSDRESDSKKGGIYISPETSLNRALTKYNGLAKPALQLIAKRVEEGWSLVNAPKNGAVNISPTGAIHDLRRSMNNENPNIKHTVNKIVKTADSLKLSEEKVSAKAQLEKAMLSRIRLPTEGLKVNKLAESKLVIEGLDNILNTKAKPPSPPPWSPPIAEDKITDAMTSAVSEQIASEGVATNKVTRATSEDKKFNNKQNINEDNIMKDSENGNGTPVTSQQKPPPPPGRPTGIKPPPPPNPPKSPVSNVSTAPVEVETRASERASFSASRDGSTSSESRSVSESGPSLDELPSAPPPPVPAAEAGLSANQLRDQIIDNAIADLKKKGYELRDNKHEKDGTTHDRLRPHHLLKGEGMRNKIYDSLVAGLEDTYVQSDAAVIQDRITKFLISNASTLSPKQTSYKESLLDGFRDSTLKLREGVYKDAQEKNYKETWEVLKNSSVRDADLAKTVQSVGAEVNGLDSDYRARNKESIKAIISRVAEDGVPKVRADIRASSQMKHPVLAEVFEKFDRKLSTEECQNIADKLNPTLERYNDALMQIDNKKIVVDELSRIITEKRGVLGSRVDDKETLGLMFEAAEGRGLIATNSVLGSVAANLEHDFRGKNAKLKISDEQIHKIATALAPAIEACGSLSGDKAAAMAKDIYDHMDMNRKYGNAMKIKMSDKATISVGELGKIADYIKSTYGVATTTELQIAEAFAKLRDGDVNIKHGCKVLTAQPIGANQMSWLTRTRYDVAQTVDTDLAFKQMNEDPKAELNRMLAEYTNAKGAEAEQANAAILAANLTRFLNNTKDVPLSEVYSNKNGVNKSDKVLTQNQTKAINALKELCGIAVAKEHGGRG